jgi:uncharacterized membrane protein YdbT with pleckstrin-like domain
MSYIDETLGRDEALHYRARFPAIYYVGAWLLLIVFAAAGVILALNDFGWPGLAVGLVGLVLFLSTMLPIWATEIGVTTQRFIYKRGLVWRSSQELQLRSIEEVNLDQSLLGRLFNFGRVALHGTGVGDIKLPLLAEPVVLQRAVQEAIGALTQVNAVVPAASETADRPASTATAT